MHQFGKEKEKVSSFNALLLFLIRELESIEDFEEFEEFRNWFLENFKK